MRFPAAGTRPPFSATTAHLQALYPFAAQSAIGAPGAYIGTDACGGAWLYDPWELYERKIIRSPNMLVLGGIGYAKSSFLKIYIYRQRVFGVHAWVIDVKGEYAPLAEALGATVISLAPGGELRLNPLERRGGRQSQLSLLRSVAIATLKRELEPEEDAGLRVALDLVNEECGDAREPTLPMAVDALFHPREAMVAGVFAKSAEDFRDANRDCALALQRLCEGDLRGMFDGPTSEVIDLEAPLVVLDLSAVKDSSALGALMTCAASWQQSVLISKKQQAEREGVAAPKMISAVEEVWKVAHQIGVAEWLQANFKLCRDYGIQNALSAHRLTDFEAAGEHGSRGAKIVEGLIADSGTVVLYNQAADQREALEGRLGLGETEFDLSQTLGVNETIWVMGEVRELVRVHLSGEDWRITYTDEAMRVGARMGAPS
jgi:hypothetical protein